MSARSRLAAAITAAMVTSAAPVGAQTVSMSASRTEPCPAEAACALDQPPAFLTPPSVPPPWAERAAHAWFVVVVNPDGTVDSGLTRLWAHHGGVEFYSRAHETIRRWKFRPGTRGGQPVRSAFGLWIQTGTRVDTLPSRLDWHYVQGTGTDTLAGVWSAQPALPPVEGRQRDSVHLAVVRELVRMQVLARNSHQPYCILVPGADSAALARVREDAISMIPMEGHPHGVAVYDACERDPGTRRLVLPRVHRTEAGRVVVYPTGDFLPHYPQGFDSRAWPVWEARCIADLPDSAAHDTAVRRIDCGVDPVTVPDEVGWVRSPHPYARRESADWVYDEGDSVRVTVLVTTGSAYQVDTIETVVREIGWLDRSAVLDSSGPCANSWFARSEAAGDSTYLVWGDPDGTGLQVTQIGRGAPRGPRRQPMRCGPDDPPVRAFAAFFLGGFGDPPQEPVTLCFASCARAYVLNPARHTIGARVALPPGRIRPETWTDGRLLIRLIAQPTPPRLRPLVVIRAPGQWPTAFFMHRVEVDAWDYPVSHASGIPRKAEVFIYLVSHVD